MNKKQKPPIKGKGATVGLVICFVAAIALVGTYTFRQYKSETEDQLAKVEEQEDDNTNEEQETTGQDIVIETPQKEEPATTTPEDTGTNDNASQGSQATGAAASEVSFSDTSKITWPIDGKILINFSMDKTVYFSTLDQYKYNPAVVIGGEVGTEVKSAARGIVKSVSVSPETGTTVTVDIGGGYEAVYGQLKEVPVEEGAYVDEGALIGYLSEPTKYYSVEGCNLYFEMLKDGTPVNPLEYLE